jgi:hypothetical protein
MNFGQCSDSDIKEAKERELFCVFADGSFLTQNEGEKYTLNTLDSVVDLKNNIIGPRNEVQNYREKKKRKKNRQFPQDKTLKGSIQDFLISFDSMSTSEIDKLMDDLGLHDQGSKKDKCMCVCKFYYDTIVGSDINPEKDCPCEDKKEMNKEEPGAPISYSSQHNQSHALEREANQKTVVFNLEPQPPTPSKEKKDDDRYTLETEKGTLVGNKQKLKTLQEIMGGQLKQFNGYSAEPRESSLNLTRSPSGITKREDIGFSSSLTPIRNNITKSFEECLRSISIS